MQIFIWVLIQLALFGLGWWIYKRRAAAAVGEPIKKKTVSKKDDTRELAELKKLRERALSMPLTEAVRPAAMEDIIGQSDGIRALRAAICGPNPQHVIIYGPPGCGKTCAARLLLEEAKKCPVSPFNEESKFIEVDATCVRFDERAIADPLMGSVHDPIYQGAGALGSQGVPQPKPGAVTRAHCGILFLDEIGELHPMQMSKLLKVLEDRKVNFDSAYYSKDNSAIPQHIHDIFQNGLPADFRLVGATTRAPEELSPALRSRCVELFFRELTQDELACVAQGAARRVNVCLCEKVARELSQYCASARDAVNMVQLAASGAANDGRLEVSSSDVQWVAEVCRCQMRYTPALPSGARPGVCAGLAVTGTGHGAVIEIECSVTRAAIGEGKLDIGGIVDSEQIELSRRVLKRKSTARTSVENVLGAYLNRFGLDCRNYDIRYNVPGGLPVDGPSAGIAFAVALMSALSCKAPAEKMTYTGEITVNGEVRPVGGVREKVAAAIEAGAHTVVVPKANYEPSFEGLEALVIPVDDITQVMRTAFDIPKESELGVVLPLIITA